jgi:hypothetical protein
MTRAAIAGLLIALGLAGCSQDDSYSQKQLDLAVKRAENRAERDGFEKGVIAGEANAIKKAGLEDANGWWYMKIEGGRLPAAGSNLAGPVSPDYAVYECPYETWGVCLLDPETGKPLAD